MRELDWGYAQHHLSVRDVVDEERWINELNWAIDNALEYALGDARPGQVYAASAFLDRSFTDSFEKHLDSNLHRPVELCSSIESEETTEQTKLVTDGGRDIDDKPLGMSGVAWRGCSCGACRGERRRFLGREELDDGQVTLGGFDDE